jgi:hypothetical protein
VAVKQARAMVGDAQRVLKPYASSPAGYSPVRSSSALVATVVVLHLHARHHIGAHRLAGFEAQQWRMPATAASR